MAVLRRLFVLAGFLRPNNSISSIHSPIRHKTKHILVLPLIRRGETSSSNHYD